MSTQRFNAVEKDLEKFIKFLALKSTQVVVQSRLGEKMQTQCNPLATGNDWFNLVIQDHPDIAAETKRALALHNGESILQRLPLCVEISLKTVEGDQMVLEVWSLDLQSPVVIHQKDKDEKIEKLPTDTNGVNASSGGGGGGANMTNGTSDHQTLKAAHAIYNRMGILLKSLISLTRSTPAYKLSRRQCPEESYGIYYRIYVDKPQVHTLGEGHKNVKIGQLNTIVGALSMSVAYRTKMTISPTATQSRGGEANIIMVKSDHFRPADTAVTKTTTTAQKPLTNGLSGGKKNSNGLTNEGKFIDIEKPLRPGAFTDINKIKQYTEEDYILPETPPFEWLITRARRDSNSGSIESINRKSNSPVSSPITNNNHTTATDIVTMQTNNNNINNNVPAFKSLENDMQKSPLATQSRQDQVNAQHNNDEQHQQQQHQQQSSTLSQSPIKSLLIPSPPLTRHSNSAPILQQSILRGDNETSIIDATPTTAMGLKAGAAAAATTSTSISTSNHEEDCLLKELNFPFASPTSRVNDLAKFYRDCYHAPPLRGLSEMCQPEIGCGAAVGAFGGNGLGTADSAAVDDLSRQLEQFETTLEDYDKLFSQLGLTGSSSTTSSGTSGLQMSN